MQNTRIEAMAAHTLILTASGAAIPDPQPPAYTVTVIVQKKEMGTGDIKLIEGVDAVIPGQASGQTDADGCAALRDVAPGNHSLELSNLPGPLPPGHTSLLSVYSDMTVVIIIPEEKSLRGGHLYSQFSNDEKVRVDNEDLFDVYETAKADGKHRRQYPKNLNRRR
jgi:hypothetical protein